VKIQTLAHLSDLHLGRSPEFDRSVVQLRDAVVSGAVDHVVVSGDITNRGRRGELARFDELFGDLARAGRLSVVPGNHDRLGDDVGASIMRARIEEITVDDLHLVLVDSTGPHNRFLLAGHGDLSEEVIDNVGEALDRAPKKKLVAVVVHHHPLPLPEETFPERFATGMGWPYARELKLGQQLLSRIRGRCDLLLHGHRHVPRSFTLYAGDARPLRLFNAGCSTQLGRFRMFAHAGGTLVGEPGWLEAVSVLPAPRVLDEPRVRTGTDR
jgi:3',5'-cyclic AMP phosphodiesterase CpdA